MWIQWDWDTISGSRSEKVTVPQKELGDMRHSSELGKEIQYESSPVDLKDFQNLVDFIQSEK